MKSRNKGKHLNVWINGDVEKIFNEIQSSSGESTTDLLKSAIRYYGLYGFGIEGFAVSLSEDWSDKD